MLKARERAAQRADFGSDQAAPLFFAPVAGSGFFPDFLLLDVDAADLIPMISFVGQVDRRWREPDPNDPKKTRQSHG